MIRLLVLLPALAACAPQPMTPERAARQCAAELNQADGIYGTVGAGISDSGPVGTGTLVVTNRVLRPQSAQEFFAECVERRVAGRPEPTTFGVSVGGDL